MKDHIVQNKISYTDNEVKTSEEETIRKQFGVFPIGLIVLDKNFNVQSINDQAKEILRIDEEHFDVAADLTSAIGCYFDENKSLADFPNHTCEKCELKSKLIEMRDEKQDIKGFEVKRIVNRDGEEKWLYYKINGIQLDDSQEILLLIEDITESKKIKKRLVQITNHMSDLVFQVDHQGIIKYITPSVSQLLGYDEGAFINRSIGDFIYEEDRNLAFKLMAQRLETKQNFFSELRVVHKDGKIIWIEASGTCFMDEGKRCLVYSCRDITENRLNKIEMEKSKEMAMESSAAKSRFLANMSHEIRTPMNGIMGMTNLLLMSKIDDEQRENLMMINKSAKNLLGVIDGILDFSKLEADMYDRQYEAFDIREMIMHLNKAYRLEASSKGIDYICNIDETLPYKMYGDETALTQIINNLVSNALKFTLKGHVALDVRCHYKHGNLVQVVFRVVDSGIGMMITDEMDIFDSFYQIQSKVKPKYKGTGLGLSITKKLVDILDGNISYNTEVDKGTVFEVEIPMTVKRIREVDHKNVMTIPVSDLMWTMDVLIVEDDRINRYLTKELLERQGHRVVTVENGQEAVDVCRTQIFDMILMDIQLPVMDGIEATKHIKKIYGLKAMDVPIIAMTAYAVEGDREYFLEKGMDDYISKPIDVIEFFNLISKNMERFKSKTSVSEQRENYELENLINHVSSDVGEGIHTIDAMSVNKIDALVEAVVLYGNKGDFNAMEEMAHRLKLIATELNLKSLKKVTFKMEMAARKEDQNFINEYATILKSTWSEIQNEGVSFNENTNS